MNLKNPTISKSPYRSAHSEKFDVLVKFLQEFAEFRPWRKGKKPLEFSSIDFKEKLAKSFDKGRDLKSPKEPKTIPDGAVNVILLEYYGLGKEQLEDARKMHVLSMGAENIIGGYLENYLATVLEPLGWVWCSGSTATSIDFIRDEGDGKWTLLQVKNRDNSENSSSAKVRDGTEIKKWHRTYSKKDGCAWAIFPDVEAKQKLSEDDFLKFISKSLKEQN